jgi:hypothetical protein
VCNIEQTVRFKYAHLAAGHQVRIWGPMHDRDSDYYRAIRMKVGDALRAQYDLSEPLTEPLTKALLKLDRPKGLDLDDREQRRRFLDDER